MDEITIPVEASSAEPSSEKVEKVNQHLVNTEEKSSENSVTANASEIPTNDKLPVQIENGKCDDETAAESTIQSDVVTEVENEKSSTELPKVSALNQNDAGADSNTKDESIQDNSENTSGSNEKPNEESSKEEQSEKKIEPSSDTSDVKKSDNKDLEVKTDELSEKLGDIETNNTEMPQNADKENEVDVDSKVPDSKDDEPKNDNKKHEVNYTTFVHNFNYLIF